MNYIYKYKYIYVLYIQESTNTYVGEEWLPVY